MHQGSGGDEAVFDRHCESGRFEAGEKARPNGRGQGVKIENVNFLNGLLKPALKTDPAWGVRKEKDAVFDLPENDGVYREVWFVKSEPS